MTVITVSSDLSLIIMVETDMPSFKKGIETIRAYAKKLGPTPGVYRMLGEDGEVLYVGKAKALSRRVLSYTHIDKLPMRLKRMVSLTRSMEFVDTQTEVEALLLESNLIKKLEPRFNVYLRDDKSFPYIAVSSNHAYPRISKYRGAKTKEADYFGPFASAGLVNRTLTVLQRAFMLRNCTDNMFESRSRPCLQYHIKRCTAPCVGYVSEQDYARQVEEARSFLSGESDTVRKRFTKKMEQASAEMDYETAARYRDRIRAMTSIQSHQDVNVQGLKDADIFALSQNYGRACIQVFFFRAGQNYGNHAYYPKNTEEESASRIIAGFITQFYETKPVPAEVILSHDPEDKSLLTEALSLRAGKNIALLVPQRGQKKRLVEFAVKNAGNALERQIAENAGQERLLKQLAKTLGLEDKPDRIEVYDNSHISGTNKVGAMIVAGPEGFVKKAYRKFNIRADIEGDDYAMMREVLERRFKRALKEGLAAGAEGWPDVVIIDGGKGQLSVAADILEECGVLNDLCLIAIAKGPDRHAGREVIYQTEGPPVRLGEKDALLHYLQRLRDEAHRFAIGAHRSRRAKDIKKSPLDEIPGIGPARKKALLTHFGSARGVSRAGLEDLEKVDGISGAVAERIYGFFRS